MTMHSLILIKRLYFVCFHAFFLSFVFIYLHLHTSMLCFLFCKLFDWEHGNWCMIFLLGNFLDVLFFVLTVWLSAVMGLLFVRYHVVSFLLELSFAKCHFVSILFVFFFICVFYICVCLQLQSKILFYVQLFPQFRIFFFIDTYILLTKCSVFHLCCFCFFYFCVLFDLLLVWKNWKCIISLILRTNKEYNMGQKWAGNIKYPLFSWFITIFVSFLIIVFYVFTNCVCVIVDVLMFSYFSPIILLAINS